jgi:hypothetical protein
MHMNKQDVRKVQVHFLSTELGCKLMKRSQLFDEPPTKSSRCLDKIGLASDVIFCIAKMSCARTSVAISGVCKSWNNALVDNFWEFKYIQEFHPRALKHITDQKHTTKDQHYWKKAIIRRLRIQNEERRVKYNSKLSYWVDHTKTSDREIKEFARSVQNLLHGRNPDHIFNKWADDGKSFIIQSATEFTYGDPTDKGDQNWFCRLRIFAQPLIYERVDEILEELTYAGIKTHITGVNFDRLDRWVNVLYFQDFSYYFGSMSMQIEDEEGFSIDASEAEEILGWNCMTPDNEGRRNPGLAVFCRLMLTRSWRVDDEQRDYWDLAEHE